MAAARCRVLVRSNGLSEIVTIEAPADLTHDQFIAALRRSLKRAALTDAMLGHMWVVDKDFPDVPVLLTDWPTFFAANGAPPAVRIDVQQQQQQQQAEAVAVPSNQAAHLRAPQPTLGQQSVSASGSGLLIPSAPRASAKRVVALNSGYMDDSALDHQSGEGSSLQLHHEATALGAPFFQPATPRPSAAMASPEATAVDQQQQVEDESGMFRRGTMVGEFVTRAPAGPPPNSVPWAGGAGAATQPSGQPAPQPQQKNLQKRPSTRHVPLRIFLVRHGESETNVDRKVYDTTPDHAVALTDRGRQMAEESGRALRNYLKRTFGSKRDVDHHIRMYVSPFRRTRETAEGLIRSLNDCNEQWVDSVRESTLLAEQDLGAKEGMGRLADEKYREEFERINIKVKHGGRFWCRMPNGESAFDVCHRISAFFPDVLMAANVETAERKPVKTVIVVSHGITIRAFLTNWCRYSPEWFNASTNPPNCSIQLIEDQHDKGYFFGGWNMETHIERPLDVFPLARSADPQHARWSMFLNQAASADRRDLDRVHPPSAIDDNASAVAGAAPCSGAGDVRDAELPPLANVDVAR